MKNYRMPVALLAGLLLVVSACAPARPAAEPTAAGTAPAPAIAGPVSAAPTAAVASATSVSPLAPFSPLGTPGSGELTILHTNDTWGYIDPCG
jgi:hypothetical protein